MTVAFKNIHLLVRPDEQLVPSHNGANMIVSGSHNGTNTSISGSVAGSDAPPAPGYTPPQGQQQYIPNGDESADSAPWRYSEKVPIPRGRAGEDYTTDGDSSVPQEVSSRSSRKSSKKSKKKSAPRSAQNIKMSALQDTQNAVATGKRPENGDRSTEDMVRMLSAFNSTVKVNGDVHPSAVKERR